MQFVPSMLRVVQDQPGFERYDSVRNVISGGEVLPYGNTKALCLAAGAQLRNLYGPTRTSIAVTAWACQEGNSGKTVPMGRPIADTSDLHPRRVRRDGASWCVGRLRIGGASVREGAISTNLI